MDTDRTTDQTTTGGVRLLYRTVGDPPTWLYTGSERVVGRTFKDGGGGFRDVCRTTERHRRVRIELLVYVSIVKPLYSLFLFFFRPFVTVGGFFVMENSFY